MVLLTLLLAGLQPPPALDPMPARKKQPPMTVVSPPPITVPMPVGVPNGRPSPPRPPVPVLTAPLDLALVKQPKLDKFYPKELRKAGLEDSATVNLTIDREGNVTACRLRSAPANPAFAEPACALGAKLQFARAVNDYPWPLPIKIEWRGGGVALVRGVPPRPARLVPGSVTISESDYPMRMRRANIEGREVAVVAIAPDGKAGGCGIEWADVPAPFDEASCRVLSRGKFVPARDEFGVAVPGRVAQPIRWQLEDIDPLPVISYSLIATIKLSAAGKIMSCKTNKTGPVPAEDIEDVCSQEASDEVLESPPLARLSGHATQIIIQYALTIDGDPMFIPVRPRVAGAVNVHSLTHFEITADGKTAHCRVVEAVGGDGDPCDDAMWPFVATTGAGSARPRSGSYYNGLLAEPAP